MAIHANPGKTTKSVKIGIKGIQQTLRMEGERLLNRDDLAETLAKKNLLRQTTTIQISSNKNFLSIEFDTKEAIETFCLDLLLVKDLIIQFHPEKDSPKKGIS